MVFLNPTMACERRNIGTQRNAIDKVIMGFIALLAALPFGQVFHLQLGFITTSAFGVIYLALVALIIIKILMSESIKKDYLPFLLLLATVIISAFISVVVYGVSVVDFMRQLRSYLPFIVATMLLLTGVDITIERCLRILVIAAIISSAIALVMQHLMPDMLAKMLSGRPDLVALTTIHGRLYWANAMLVFFVLLVFMLPRKTLGIHKIIMYTALVLTLAALFNTLSRTMMIGYALFIVGHLLLGRRIGLIFKRSAKIFACVILSTMIIFGLMSIDPRIHQLIEKRFSGFDYGLEQVYVRTIAPGRLFMYKQYADSIKTYFPIGQGLGRPFHIWADGVEVPVTDISVMAFLLPFGILGLIVFGVFIYTLFRLASRGAKFANMEKARIVMLLLVVSLIMSLNIDLYSRNNFVIFATMLVLALQNPSKYNRIKA